MDSRFGIDEELLLTKVTSRFGQESGERTELELTMREAFDVLRLPPEKPKKESF